MIDPATTLRDLPLAVIDTETTGVEDDARIVEIAVVHVELGALQGYPRVAFRSVVNPGIPIPDKAARIHKITDEVAAEAPVWADIAAEVEAACAGRLPCAYSATFDHGKILAHGLDLGWPWLDLAVPARSVDKYLRGKSLVEVARRRGIELVDAHGAVADAMATALIADPLLRQWFGWLAAEGAGYLAPYSTPRDVRALTEAVRAVAIGQEAEFVGYMRDKWGMYGRERPDCSWHEITGTPLPYWNDEAGPPVSECRACGAPVLLRVTEGGEIAASNPDETAHTCPSLTDGEDIAF